MRGKILGVGLFVFILGLILAGAGAAANIIGTTQALYTAAAIFLLEGLGAAIYGGAAKPPTHRM